ncbi:MAG TPA: prepilin-type N-terminal cleavage/methylation domain-containing protein [Luteolibacter sp.]
MRSNRVDRRGFSLVELMFSMAVGSMILILATSLLGISGDGYERVGGNVASECEARALVTRLAADLSSGSYHEDGVIVKSSPTWPADRIGFLTLQPAQAQTETGRIGDLCAVNYYLKDLTIGGKNIRCLMRGFRESQETFRAVRDDSIGALFDARSNLDEPVAFGVVSFEARPKSRDTGGKWIDWVKSGTTGPEAFEVKLVVARRDLVGKLKLPDDWDGAGSAGKLLGEVSEAHRNKHLELYVATLRFGNYGTL